MNTWNLCILFLHLCQIAEHVSSPVKGKDVKAARRLLAAIFGYRKEDLGFISEVLKVHNKYRQIHGCRDLSQCSRLRQQAGLYAQALADQGARAPQTDPKLEFGIGENIYISCGHDVSAEEAVNNWYNEGCNYFGNKKSWNEYKHFAQVVWKASYLIGIGRRTTTKSGQTCTYVVTRYRPGAEQGPSESVNIPKGNFDSSATCSGNAAPSGFAEGTGSNAQVSTGATPQQSNSGPSVSSAQPATNVGVPTPAGQTTGSSASGPGQEVGLSNVGSLQTGVAGTQPAQSTGETVPAARGPGAETANQPDSNEPAGLPNSGQPAGNSAPAGSVGPGGITGGITGSSGTTGSNSIPGVTPTSVPGTGDRERAADPENAHVSPLIEQTSHVGSEGSSQESVGEQVSPTTAPHCPPCTGNQDQTESFETAGGAERLPEEKSTPSSTGEGEQPSTNSNIAGSTDPDRPTDQANPVDPDKPAEQVNPGDQGNSVEPDKPAEQVNPPKPDEPAQQVNPSGQANSAEPDKPAEQANPGEPVNPDKPSLPQASGGVSSGSGKQCPPCSCPNKQENEKPGVGVPQGSQGNQPQTGEGSESSPSQEGPGEQGRPSGNEVSQGQPSEGNSAPTDEVKPSSEGGNAGGNVASPESTGEATSSENPPASQGSQEKNNESPQGASEGSSEPIGTSGTPPIENQPASQSQPAETGSPSSGNEGAGGDQGGSPGVTASESQPESGNPDGNDRTQGGGESAGETGGQGTGDGQGGATQGTSGYGGGKTGDIPEGGAFVEDLGVFQQSALEAHNKYRKFHNSPPLTLNSEMSIKATEFAQKLSKSSINKSEHSPKSSRVNEGENIYAACGTNPSGADVTKEWYKELCNYNYNKNTAVDETKLVGHFTQVVWKSSTELGIGRAYDGDDCVYIVGRYQPPGNIVGSEGDNIERGTMDSEYCGREFAAMNKPENGNEGEQSSVEGKPGSTDSVGSEQQNQNTNEVSQPESSASETNEQNSNTGTSETNQSETTGSEGGRQETSTEGTNEQSQTNPVPSGEGEGNKRIKTPYLPGYLQKTILENNNKRYKGLRTE